MSRRPSATSFLKPFRRSTELSIGTVMFVGLVLLFALGPTLAPYPYARMGVGRPFADAFVGSHLLGTDELGRDVLSRVIHGTRYSLIVAFSAAALATLVGGFLGMLAGFFQGWLDVVIMRVADLLLSFPSLLLAIVVVAILGPGITNTAIVIGIVYAPRVARIARGAVMSVKENDYVTAATALGVRRLRVLLRHVLPNVLPTLAVYMSLLLAYGLLFEASLSFLGLGVQPPLPSWGAMLRSARSFIQIAPGLSIWPGFAIMYAVLTFFFLAEGLRAVLDPRLRDR
jgi:peptide/nickel transport system permease protein